MRGLVGGCRGRWRMCGRGRRWRRIRPSRAPQNRCLAAETGRYFRHHVWIHEQPHSGLRVYLYLRHSAELHELHPRRYTSVLLGSLPSGKYNVSLTHTVPCPLVSRGIAWDILRTFSLVDEVNRVVNIGPWGCSRGNRYGRYCVVERRTSPGGQRPISNQAFMEAKSQVKLRSRITGATGPADNWVPRQNMKLTRAARTPFHSLVCFGWAVFFWKSV